MFDDLADSLACVDGDEAELAALVALSGLPHLAPGRFRDMLATSQPQELWQRIVAGKSPLSGRSRDAAHRWTQWASQVHPAAVLEHHREGSIQVSWFGSSAYPSMLGDDPDPPVVVFARGSGFAESLPGVAIVGTRRCSRYGSQVANELGARLASSGVTVVSGLAHGIDAAAHAGALRQSGTAVALVAGGVDVIYPKGNRELWQAVTEQGCVVSEYPLGASPLTWRFPARNRLIAALSVMVIVVESPAKGGSMYTVDEALRRDRLVAAVPGSIYSRTSAGTNRLIRDGAFPLCSLEELTEALPPGLAVAARRARVDSAGEQLNELCESWLLAFVGFDPTPIDEVVVESERSTGDVALEVERLVGLGVVHRSGAMIERIR